MPILSLLFKESLNNKDMDQKTYIKRFALWTAVIVVSVVSVCGIFFGKVIEANIYEEVAKWVAVTLALIGVIIEPLVIVVIAPFCYHAFYERKK